MPMNPRLLRPRARQAGALPPDPNANLRSGLIAFYPLSNGSDSSGNGRNLTATNITYQAGKIGNGAYFDGSAYFATSSLPAFTGADMTIAGWFKNIGEDYEDFLIGAGAGDNSLYIVRVGGDIKASASESNVENFAGGSGANDGNWHFFAVTRTATQKKVWLDQTVNSVGGTYGALNNPTPFSVGSNFNNTYLLLDGMMDAVGIWNRALSDAEIAQLYNAGAGLEISATPPVAPDAPTSLSATAGNGQVSLSWTAPASNGGAAITDYTVQFSSNGGSTWSTFADGTSTATSATVTGLANGTAYVFRVAAVNAAGTGAYTAASSSVTPAVGLPTIAGLQLHLDASDASTLFDATTGGSLVAADGSVARWQDKSGNGRHATQSTSGSRPTRKTNIQNGLGVLRFDGSDDFISVPSSTSLFTFLHDGDNAVFMVFKVNVPSSSRRRLLDNAINNGSPSGNKGFSIAYFNDFGSSLPYSKIGKLVVNSGAVRVNSYTGDNSYPNDTFVLLTINSDPANATDSQRAVFYRNGALQSVTPNTEGAAVPSGNSTYDLTIFASGGATARTFAAGDLCEVIAYSSALSSTDRAAVESYLMTKWGIV